MTAFLDKYVEHLLLTTYLATSPELFYNVKTVGSFLPGNTFGGSPNSGSPSQPVSYSTNFNVQSRTYTWESVSAAGRTFNVTPKLIRTKINSGKMVYLNPAEYQNFIVLNQQQPQNYIKISNTEANTFFSQQGQLQEYKQIYLELFPKKASNL